MATMVMALLGCAIPLANEVDRLASENGLAGSTLVRRGAIGYAPRVVNGTLQVVAVGLDQGEDGLAIVATHHPALVGRAVIIAGGAATGENPPCCAFVFGTATADVRSVRVEIAATQASVAVEDGLWLVVMPIDEIDPSRVFWEFVGEDGRILEAGAGPLATSPQVGGPPLR